MARKVMVNGLDIGYIPPTVASDVAYSNTTSGLASTTVQGAIDEVSQMASSGLGTPVDIVSDHRSFNKAYVFPSDGYITYRTRADDPIDFRVYGSNATHSTDPYIHLGITSLQAAEASFYEDQALYVRKGMKAYIVSGMLSVNFIPLI